MLLAAGWKAYKIWPHHSGPEAAEVNDSQAEPAADTESRMQQTEADYGKNSAYFSAMIGRTSEYINNTIYSRMDPNQVGKASVDFTVTTEMTEKEAKKGSSGQDLTLEAQSQAADSGQSGDTFDTNLLLTTPAEREAEQILNAYTRYALYGIDWTEAAETYHTKPEYLQELVSVDDGSGDSINTATISVIYPDQDGAEALLNEVISQIRKYSEDVKREYGEHTLAVQNEMGSTVADFSLIERANNRLNVLNGLINGSNSFKTAANTLGLSSSAASSAGTEAAVSRSSLIRSVAKFALAGLAGGIVLYIILGMLTLLASGRIYSASEVNRQYGFTKIAVVPSTDAGERKGLERFSRRDADEYCSSGSRETCWQIARENLSELAGGSGSVAIVGDADREELEAMAGAIGANCPDLKVEAAGDILSSPAALHSLKEAGKVVIGVKIGSSRYQRLDRILDTLRTYDKEAIGSIILDD